MITFVCTQYTTPRASFCDLFTPSAFGVVVSVLDLQTLGSGLAAGAIAMARARGPYLIHDRAVSRLASAHLCPLSHSLATRQHYRSSLHRM